MENNIAVYQQMVEKAGYQAIDWFGDQIAASGLLGVKTKPQGVVLAMACITENKAPLELAKKYHFVKNRLTMRADYMLSEFYKRGGSVKFLQNTDEIVEVTFINEKFKEGYTVKHTLKDLTEKGVAKADSGGLKSNYKRHPSNMLRARVISDALRVVDPEIIAGSYTPEEVQDFNDEPLVDIKPSEPLFTQADVVVEPITPAMNNQQPLYDQQLAGDSATAPVTEPMVDINNTNQFVQQPIIQETTEQLTTPKQKLEEILVNKNALVHFKNWLINNGHIQPEQEWCDAPMNIVTRAAANPERFLQTIGVGS